MKNKKVKHSIRVLTAATIFISSTRVQAIDLNTTTQNTDRSFFNTINSPYKLDKGTFFNFNLAQSANPLVLKRNDGTVVPLIQGLNVLELSFSIGMTDWLQLGIMVPGERPYGIVGSYNDAKQYLNNILIEPKIYLMDGVALIPIYYVPTSNSIDTQINGVKTTVPVGKEKGGYGAKLAVGFGDPKKDEVLTAFQIGAIMAPESKFREIDQTNRFQLNAGMSIPLSGTLRLLAEAYAEKTKNNTPVEALASIEYKNDNFLLRVGGGSDVTGTGSNTSKVLANFTYYFGDSKEKDTGIFGEPIRRNENKEDSKPIRVKPENTNDPMEEQNGPTSSIDAKGMFAKNELIVQRRSVPVESTPIPKPKEKVPSAQEVYIYAERKKSKEDFLISDEDDDQTRKPASDQVDENEEAGSTRAQIEKRANKKLEQSIQLLDYNLFLYQIAQASNNVDAMNSLKTELKWGLRVYNKNVKTLSNIGKSITIANQADLAQMIVDDVKVTFPEQKKKVVDVESTLNARSAPAFKAKNVVMKLNKLDKVIVLGKAMYGEFVQVQLLEGKLPGTQIFVSDKYLKDYDQVNVIIGKKEEDVIESKQDTAVKISSKYPFDQVDSEKIDEKSATIATKKEVVEEKIPSVKEMLNEIQSILDAKHKERMDQEVAADKAAYEKDQQEMVENAKNRKMVSVEFVNIVIPAEKKAVVTEPKKEEVVKQEVKTESPKEVSLDLPKLDLNSKEVVQIRPTADTLPTLETPETLKTVVLEEKKEEVATAPKVEEKAAEAVSSAADTAKVQSMLSNLQSVVDKSQSSTSEDALTVAKGMKSESKDLTTNFGPQLKEISTELETVKVEFKEEAPKVEKVVKTTPAVDEKKVENMLGDLKTALSKHKTSSTEDALAVAKSIKTEQKTEVSVTGPQLKETPTTLETIKVDIKEESPKVVAEVKPVTAPKVEAKVADENKVKEMLGNLQSSFDKQETSKEDALALAKTMKAESTGTTQSHNQLKDIPTELETVKVEFKEEVKAPIAGVNPVVVPKVEEKKQEVVAAKVETPKEVKLDLPTLDTKNVEARPTIDSLPSLEKTELMKAVVVEEKAKEQVPAIVETKSQVAEKVEIKVDSLTNNTSIEENIPVVVEQPTVDVKTVETKTEVKKVEAATIPQENSQTFDQLVNAPQEFPKVNTEVKRAEAKAVDESKLPKTLPQKTTVTVEQKMTGVPAETPVVVVVVEESKVEVVPSVEKAVTESKVDVIPAQEVKQAEVVSQVKETVTETKIDVAPTVQQIVTESTTKVVTPEKETKVEVVEKVTENKDTKVTEKTTEKTELVDQSTGSKVDIAEVSTTTEHVKAEDKATKVEEKATDSKIAVEPAKPKVEGLDILKESAEGDVSKKQVESMLADKKEYEQEMAAKRSAEEQLKQDRITKSKNEELKKINEIMDAKKGNSLSDLIDISESDKKEVVQKTPAATEKKKFTKDGLYEEDAMEEQSGPSFDDL